LKHIFDTMKVTGVKVPFPNERVLKVLLSPEIGNTDGCTVLLSLISPGNGTGSHTHSSDEIMYIVSGRGMARVRNETSTIREGILLFAPRDVEHEVRNTGDETIKVFCVYVPPLKPAGYHAEAVTKAKEYFDSLQ